MKEYLFVKFKKGVADVIHRTWMLGNSHCLWPANGHAGDMARKKIPSDGDWKKTSCTVLFEYGKHQAWFT